MSQNEDIHSPIDGRSSFPFLHRFKRLTFYIIWKLLCSWQPASLQIHRHLLLRLFGAEIDTGARIYGSVVIWDPLNLKLGKYSALGPRVKIYNPGQCTIGNGSIISQDSTLCSATHDYQADNFNLVTRNIEIGDKVWVAAEAFIGPGASLQRGCVIGARSVVFGNVEQWAVVSGNPAKTQKYRKRVKYIYSNLETGSSEE